MATNQEGVHAAVRELTGTARSYNEDWHALFTQDGISSGTFNERLLNWINDQLGTSYSNVNSAMTAFAVDQGFNSWSAMNTFSVVVRALDIGGPELVTNGLFASNITGWTDGSSAGGAISWNSGALRSTNTSGTARARQTVTVESGERYAYFAQNVGGSVAGSMTLGSTAAGSSDYINFTTNPAIAARASVTQFTASTTSAFIQFAAPIAGALDFDNVTLRKLTSTNFSVGTVFVDDFSLKADGPMGVTPDNLIWRQMPPANASHVYPFISGGKLQATASGSTTTASYPYLNLGDGRAVGMHCDLSWNGTGAGVAMISMTPTGTVPTVANIVANSLHIVFSHDKVDLTKYVGGVASTTTVNYAAPCATDGTVYPNVGWSLSGSALTVTMPDGTTTSRTDSDYETVSGPVAIFEHFYGSGVTGTVSIHKTSVRLG